MSSPKPKILCLEDDKSFIEFYTDLFSFEYDVACATSLSEAERLLNTQDIRLALVDISLIPNDSKDAGGFRFLEKLQSLGLITDLPTIIVTAYEKPEFMRKAFRDYGVRDFFSKQQLNPSELKKAVESGIASTYPAKKIGEIPRVLVVDDEADWREVLKELLETEGCEVDTASTYEEAIDKISSNSYHLATVDVRLNELDTKDSRGFDLLDVAKRIGLSIDSVVVSAVATTDQVAWALTELGVRDFIGKTDFKREYFLRRVRKLLSRLIYVTVDVELEAKSELLKMGKEQTLSVGISKTRPQRGYSRSLTRPTTAGAFELEVVVHPYDVDVLSGSTQFLTVLPDDSAEPINFLIIPSIVGRIELVIDLFFRSNMLARMTITKEAEE